MIVNLTKNFNCEIETLQNLVKDSKLKIEDFTPVKEYILKATIKEIITLHLSQVLTVQIEGNSNTLRNVDSIVPKSNSFR